MTHRERVIAALRFEKTDRVPYQVGFTYQMLEKMINHTNNPDYLSTLDNHIVSTSLFAAQIEVKPEYFRDEFGVVWNKSAVDKDIGVIDSILIPDLDRQSEYAFPPVDEPYLREKIERMLASRGDRFAAVSVDFSLFERAWTLHGMENLLYDMIDNPDGVHALMRRVTDRNLKLIDIALRYDIDGVYFGDDWGQQRGLIMGPGHWRTFIKPYLAEMYDKVRSAGKAVIQHSCGDIRQIMDELHEMGLNVYQTFQPEIYGYDYAKQLRGKIAVWGGISTQADLPFKTPAEIKAVIHTLLTAFSDGGLIAAPTHAVPGDVPPENILAMIEALEGK